MERFIDLCKRHKKIMETKNIIISVYTNASGFLWSICKVDSGTDLGWCGFNGNCKWSGAFKSYEDCLEDAIELIDKCDLEKFVKESDSSKYHWSNYAEYLNKKYRKIPTVKSADVKACPQCKFWDGNKEKYCADCADCVKYREAICSRE